MFFVMCIFLLALWNTIFESMNDISIWAFRIFLILYILMFVMTVFMFQCYG